VVLTSIIMTPTMQMAIVQDTQTRQSYRARMGQALEGPYSGWKLVAMTPRSAIFDSGSQGRTTLVLRVFDGHGGEMPTRMGLTPQVVASGALANAAATNAIVNSMMAPPPPPPPDVSVQQPSADNANDAANAAAEAAQQAEQIRKRIEARRQQAQAQGADAPPPNEKR
jgi:general secretion pathway protein N